MIDLLRQNWWKWIGGILLLVVIPCGLLIPLSPGIIQVNEAKLAAGQSYQLEILCYNTHFSELESAPLALLRYEVEGSEVYICADEVEVANDNRITASFDIPASLPERTVNTFFTLIVNDDIDGTFELREAFTLDLDNSDFVTGEVPACEPEVSTNEAAGLHFPFRVTLNESIRNLFFHVPMWFGMVLLLLFSFICSILFLVKGDPQWDRMANSAVVAGIVYGFLGLFTGMLWANFTWGHPWPGDAKLNGAAIGVLTYLAYQVLRGSLDDPEKRARIASVYNIFAFIIYIIFIFVLPRLTASLHPGNGGNPAFSQYDLDNTLRIFFYPAVIGWTILGFWIMSIHLRLGLIKEKLRDSF